MIPAAILRTVSDIVGPQGDTDSRGGESAIPTPREVVNSPVEELFRMEKTMALLRSGHVPIPNPRTGLMRASRIRSNGLREGH